MSEDDAVIHFWQTIVDGALLKKASDIHIEPDSGFSHIRLRVDGHLSHLKSSPYPWHERLASRIKILARLDISEKRLPQDGQIQVATSHALQSVDCRVSTLPTLHGEKIVLRILNKRPEDLNIQNIGLQEKQLRDLQEAIEKPQGFILVTGPTGSGKTQTLYSCLKHLLDGTKNISSIEDPIEIQLKGINQVQVNEKSGLSFDLALRALLRQDPDVMMIGEIRDPQTAKTAFQAAQTGHLVLSTVHANDAASAIGRLGQLGIHPSDIANHVLCITAQRLLRLTCSACHQSDHLQTNCAHCGGTGFKGRTAVHQVMPMTPTISHLIETNRSVNDINDECARLGIADLKASAQFIVSRGKTTPEEMHREIS